MDKILISSTNGQLTTSSLGVAEKFEKQHKHVIRDIEILIKETSAQNWTNLFIRSVYVDSYGRQQKCYEITRDGFSLLVMGFTGKKALEWKLKYIEAFNLMEQKLRNGYSGINIEEIITKAVTAAVAETVKVMIPFVMPQTAQAEQPKRIRKKYRYTTQSKISTLVPELKAQVGEMIVSGEYSCQQIANYSLPI